MPTRGTRPADDAYAYGLLAAGCCDVVAEADLKPYDYLPLVPVVRGAGGAMTDWRGRELVLDPADVGPKEVLAMGCPDLQHDALKLLSW